MKKIVCLLLLVLSLCVVNFVNFKVRGESNNISDITSSDLEQGIMVKEEFIFTDTGVDYDLEKTVVYNDTIIVVGSCSTNLIFFRNYCYETIPYIAIYKNNILQWSKSILDIGYGMFTDCLYDGKNIYAIGNYESEKNISYSFIITFDLNGNILFQNDFIGNNHTHFNAIAYDENGIYVLGDTMANNLYLGDKVSHNRKGFVCKYNSSLDLQDITYFGNNGNNYLYQMVLVKDYLCIYMEVNGEGFFDLGSYGNKSQMIVRINNRLDLVDYYQFKSLNKVLIRSCFDKLVMFEYEYLSSKLIINEFDQYLHVNKKETKILENQGYQLANYEVDYSIYDEKIGKNAILLAEVVTKNDKRYENYILFNENYEIIYESELNEVNRLFQEVYLYNGYIYNFGTFTKNENNKIYGNRFVFIKKMNDNCYFNGLPGNKEIDDINMEVFGSYRAEVSYHLGAVVINVLEDVVVPLKVNVKNNEIYDINTVITFNGIGILNGKEINSNYIIDKAGTYVLELKGEDESVFVYFEIKDLCVKEAKIVYEDIYIKKAKEEIINSPKIEKLSFINLEYYEDNNDTIIIIVIVSIIGLAIGIFIPFKRIKLFKGKKREII